MVRIHNTSFSSQLTNWPNKLDCYNKVGMKCCLGTNTLAYLGPFVSYEKIKCCEYAPWDYTHNTFSL